jgi:arylsulfatase A-like enzyme
MRSILVVCCRIACGIACVGIQAGPFAAEMPSRPNVLYVVVDDLGWSDVGWHGGFAKTPTLDRLVREGVELDQHYVQPVCTPTRTALMSGRYPSRFGPHALVASNLRAMPIGTPTLASVLRSLGYATYQCGKWHLGSRPEWGPTAFGFEHGYGTLTGAADPWTHRYRSGSPYVDTWHRDGRPLQEEGNATELVAAEAVRRIEERKSPWFVYVPFHAVHTPVDAPERYKRLYDGVRFHVDDTQHDSRLRLAAMVSQVDAKVADCIAAIDRTGQRENTLVIFHSDNGGIESLKNAYDGDVGHSPLNSENDPLRGQKNTLYEGGTRVCAFVHWPGRLTPRKHRGPMHCVDWLPTIAEAVSNRPGPDLRLDGVSQWRAIQGHEAPDPSRVIYIASAGGRSVRQGNWKLIAPAKGTPQLFDIAADPCEQTDLALAQPDRVARLRELLAAERGKDVATIPEDLQGLPK